MLNAYLNYLIFSTDAYTWKCKLYSSIEIFLLECLFSRICFKNTLHATNNRFSASSNKITLYRTISFDHDKFFALTNGTYCCYLLLGERRECHCAVNRLDLHRADAITDLLRYAVHRKILTAVRVVIFVPTCFIQTRYCLAREHAKVNEINWKKKNAMPTLKNLRHVYRVECNFLNLA